jgi:branched-chain amino acid transport system ATP-binding protein
MLETRNLCKAFGGLAATADVSLQIAVGEIHGLIGPNGAGKSTLLGQIAGTLRPDSGQILWDGTNVTHRSPAQRVALGLGRSFQITSFWHELTALENVLLGAQRAFGSVFSIWARALTQAEACRKAREALEYVELAPFAEKLAGSLSYGQQKQLELAIVLAGGPKIVLLDEPLAGVGQVEAERLIALIERLRQDMGVMLVEHDMDAMFRLADRISVLHQGRIIAMGTPAAVQGDSQVRDAYLGDDLDAA